MNLTGINFWTNLKQAALLDAKDQIIEQWNITFGPNGHFTPEIELALTKHNIISV